VTGDSSTLASDPYLSSLLDYMFASCYVQSAREYGHLAELNIRSGIVKAAPVLRTRMTDEEDDAFKQATQKKMEAYLATHVVWQASTKLNSHQRRLVHVLCEELQLHHASVDVTVRMDTKRQLVVGKTQAALDQFVLSMTKPVNEVHSSSGIAPDADNSGEGGEVPTSCAEPKTVGETGAKPVLVDDNDNGVTSADSADDNPDNSDGADRPPAAVVDANAPSDNAAATAEAPVETETQRVMRERAQRLRQEQLAQQDRALLPAAGDRRSASQPSKTAGPSGGKKKGKNGKGKGKPVKAGHRLGGSKLPPSGAGGDDLDALVAAIEAGADLPASKPTGVVDAYIRQGVHCV
jgi:hypothetical protein